MQKPAIVILGVGRLGSTLACIAKSRNYPVTAITAGHRETAEAFSRNTGIPAFFDNVEAATHGDIILITAPDRMLPAILEELTAGKRLRPGQILLHTSGSLTGEVLAGARHFGASAGSMHPLQSFAGMESTLPSLSGIAFAIDGDPAAVGAASRLALDLGGTVLHVPPEERVLYHAAACIASNYLVTLLHIAENLLERWTTGDKAALQALLPLAAGTLHNVAQQGTAAALTGPIVRGDASTVAQHLKALPEELLAVYQALGRKTLQLSGSRIDPEQKEAIAGLLSADRKNN